MICRVNKVNRVKMILFKVILVTSPLMLSACAENGMFRDRINDYKTVTECASLQIPKGVAAESRSEDYYIPEKDGKSFRWFGKTSSTSSSEQSLAKAPEGKMNTKTLVLAPKKFENGELIKTNAGAEANTGLNTGAKIGAKEANTELLPKSFMGHAAPVVDKNEKKKD